MGLEYGPVYDARDGPKLDDVASRADLIQNLVRQRPSLLVCSSAPTYDIPRAGAGTEFSFMRHDDGERVEFLAAQYDEQARNGRWFRMLWP